MSRYSPTVREEAFGQQCVLMPRAAGRRGQAGVHGTARRGLRIGATAWTGRKYSAASSALQALSSISLAMTREAVEAMLQGILDRLEARKELVIAKVVPKLVGVDDVTEAKKILEELQAELLDELDMIERDLGA